MLTSETADTVIDGVRYRIEIVDALDSEATAWAHPGVCVAPGNTVLWTAPDGSTIRSLAADGRGAPRAVDAVECHGLASDDHGGVWIADPGRKARADGPEVVRRVSEGRVTRVNAVGVTTHELADPGDGWRPSGIALRDSRAAHDERIWVADGYGQSFVHCFSADGKVLWSSDGSDSGTPFLTPHGIIVDDRGASPRLLVADRGNARIVALTLDGVFIESVGEGELTSPSNFALNGSRLWVTELFGAIIVLNDDDRVVGSFGDASKSDDPIWPNVLADGRLGGPSVSPDRLRAPHGIAVTANGEVYVTEWIIGGRVIRLVPT
ncbi:hypothetical protein [Agromyces allii]|uniref:NHL repeat-containing protein n=1 Tax=Agromyces allii TaxID=393607 RepID=A0ABN2QMF4_9MICO|nr:hypothetical protein [Agromyces allii]